MVDRRAFLATSLGGAAGILASGSRTPSIAQNIRQEGAPFDQRIALTLGGGGARGLAHIPVLEAFDELGLTPKIIAGTSIGSLIGACYASGMKGKEIRSFSLELFEKRTELIKRLFSGQTSSWRSIFKLSSAAVVEADKLFELVLPKGLPDTIEELDIPIRVVATDYITQSQIILHRGPLLPAIGASCALPALLAPIKYDGRLLIDGGFVNPTPFDVVSDQAEHTIAVDLTGRQEDADTSTPGAVDLLIGSTQIALRRLVQEKLACARPAVLLTPDVRRFHSLDFYKAKEILVAAAPMKEQTKQALARLLEPNSGTNGQQ